MAGSNISTPLNAPLLPRHPLSFSFGMGGVTNKKVVIDFYTNTGLFIFMCTDEASYLSRHTGQNANTTEMF